MIFDLGLLWLIGWMLKNAVEDVTHAVKGTTNPRYELKKAKAKAAGQAPPRQPRYGGKEWFADLLSDGLAAQTERRRAKAKAKAQPVDDMVDVVREPQKPAPEQRKPVRHPHDTRNCPECKGEVVLDGRPCPTCVARQRQRNAEWEAKHGEPEWLTPSQEEMDAPTSVVHDDLHPYCLTPCGPLCTVGAEWKDGMSPIGDYEKPTCVRCRATHARPGSANCPACDRAEGNYPDDGQLTADEVLAGLAGPGGLFAGGVQPKCSWHNTPLRQVNGRMVCPACDRTAPSATAADDSPTARIYQFPNVKHAEKEITMANSEVTGLSTAIAFADQASTAHTSFATTGAEGYVGALERGGNAGEVIDTAREAMEASGIAADKWAAHRAKLQEQLNLKEAYQSQPDAADKEFLLNG